MNKISNLLIGKGLNQKGFSSLLLGKKRLKDTDKDSVPDIFDCKPLDPNRDSVIIPPALQAKRPQIPQTVAQMRMGKEQVYTGLTDEQIQEQAKRQYQKSLSEWEQEKIEVHGRYFSRKAVIDAYKQLEREAMGEKGSILYGKEEARKAAIHIQSSDIDIQQAIKYGIKSRLSREEQSKSFLVGYARPTLKKPSAEGLSLAAYEQRFGAVPESWKKEGYGPTQQVAIGRTTEGKIVYGPAGSTPYKEPVWFGEPSGPSIYEISRREGPYKPYTKKPKTIQDYTPTDKLFLTVEPAPTRMELYKEAVEEKGYVKGTLFSAGQVVSGKIATSKYSPLAYTGYDVPVGKLAATTTEYGPYFTPYVGIGLLIGGGVEELGTKAGRERIKQHEESLIYEGYEPLTAKAISWGVPVGELVLGSLGLKSQIKSVKLKSDIKEVQTKFIQVQKETEKGVEATIFSRTRVGKEDIFGIGKVDSKVIDKRTITAGEGFIVRGDYTRSLSIPTGKIKVTPPEITRVKSVGISKQIGEARITRDLGIVKIKEPVGEGVLSNVLFRVEREEIITQKLIGTTKKTPSEEISYFIGGKPKKLRIYKEGRITYVAKPSISGFIVKETAPTETFLFRKSVKTKPPTPFQPQKLEQVEKVEETALSLVSGFDRGAKQIVTTKAGLLQRGGQITSLVSKMVVEQIPKERLKITAIPKQEARIRAKQEPAFIFSGVSIISKVEEKIKVTQIPISSLITAPIIKPKITGVTIPIIKQPTTRPIPKKPIRPIFFFAGEKPEYKKEQPYDSFVLVDATKKTRRYEKLNKEPLTQSSALSMMAKAVDTTISARGKIVKTKPIIQKGIKIIPKAKDTKDKYYDRTKYKFREWATKKKKKLPTGVVIERQKFRLDSPGEVKKIHREKKKAVNIRKFFGF